MVHALLHHCASKPSSRSTKHCARFFFLLCLFLPPAPNTLFALCVFFVEDGRGGERDREKKLYLFFSDKLEYSCHLLAKKKLHFFVFFFPLLIFIIVLTVKPKKKIHTQLEKKKNLNNVIWASQAVLI